MPVFPLLDLFWLKLLDTVSQEYFVRLKAFSNLNVFSICKLLFVMVIFFPLLLFYKRITLKIWMCLSKLRFLQYDQRHFSVDCLKLVSLAVTIHKQGSLLQSSLLQAFQSFCFVLPQHTNFISTWPYCTIFKSFMQIPPAFCMSECGPSNPILAHSIPNMC